MPWATSGRRFRLPRDWKNRREWVLDRDGRVCQHIREDTEEKCGLPANHVDHIIPCDYHRASNLQSLCVWHHNAKSSSEGGRGVHGGRDKARVTHPGLIRDDDVSATRKKR